MSVTDELILPAPVAVATEPPAQAVTVIEAGRGWQVVNVGEIWRFRELLYFLTWRDLKVRYRQTVLGAAWAILQPLATMMVFTAVFRRLAAGPSDVLPYPLFAFAGLLPWTFFANAITSASQSVVGNQNLIAKVYFPRLIIPISTVGAGLVDFAIAGGMLVAMMLFYGVAPGWAVVWTPVVMLALITAALGIGICLSALTVAFRDFRYVVPFMVQLWLFATPSVYVPAETLPPRVAAALALNPAHGLIISFRSALFGERLDLQALAVSLGASLCLLVVGCVYFRRVERDFADVI